MAPDQLIYSILNELDPSDKYWRTDPNWNKTKFLNNQYSQAIASNLTFDDKSNSYTITDGVTSKKPVREYFKEWYKNNHDKIKLVGLNPIKQIWKPNHLEEVTEFKNKFEQSLKYISNLN